VDALLRRADSLPSINRVVDAYNAVSVEYALRDQPLMKQVRSAKAAGAEWVLTLHMPGRPEAPPTPHSWKPDAPPDWNSAITEIGL